MQAVVLSTKSDDEASEAGTVEHDDDWYEDAWSDDDWHGLDTEDERRHCDERHREEILSQLQGYVAALDGFRDYPQQKQAAERYADLKLKNPLDHVYANILKKLHEILALPAKLKSYLVTKTTEQANDIEKTCVSILNDNELPLYRPLFETSKYFDNARREHEPEFGVWKYNGRTYEMLKMIKDVRDIVPYYMTLCLA